MGVYVLRLVLIFTLLIAFFLLIKVYRLQKKLQEISDLKFVSPGSLPKKLNSELPNKDTPSTLGLNSIFTDSELNLIKTYSRDSIAVLSYFATSLFNKHTKEEVLWDITHNLISKLDLEDCVIYMLDPDRQLLIQKAAFGTKDLGGRKILSPIEVPIGEGIVGSVAKTQEYELVEDTTKENRYLIDDINRKSELAVPIICHGATIGVIDSEHSQVEFFGKKHVLLFQLIAKLTARKLDQITTKPQSSITNDKAYFDEFIHLLEDEHLYLDSNLSLQSVADLLNISAPYLSQIINSNGDLNFSDLINHYRVEKAKEILLDPKFNKLSILAAGFEAGFNSKSTFYTAFKKFTGVTPKGFKRQFL